MRTMFRWDPRGAPTQAAAREEAIWGRATAGWLVTSLMMTMMLMIMKMVMLVMIFMLMIMMLVIMAMTIFLQGLCVEISEGSSVCEISGSFHPPCSFIILGFLDDWIIITFFVVIVALWSNHHQAGVLLRTIKICHFLHRCLGILNIIIASSFDWFWIVEFAQRHGTVHRLHQEFSCLPPLW